MKEMPVDALTLPAPASASAPGGTRRRRPGRAERRLAARLRAGERDALEDAYRAYGAATFGLLLRLLGEREAAEDVQQQVFTEVWRRAGD
jgi:RNA polymerase sigma-70 factor, ECF subfamily